MIFHLTFDYELFVNDNTGDIDECLITPTNEILKVLQSHDIHATFFIDMAYAYRLVELKHLHEQLSNDYYKFIKQVNEIARKGHEIALHLHPQWFYADFDGGKWIMDFDHYKLSDMPLELANKKFDVCCTMLREISGYNVKSFRAGGFSIQDYEGFVEAMRRNGLVNDSSALFKEKQITTLHCYDYTSLTSPSVFTFSNICNYQFQTPGDLTEYPIATRSIPFLEYCILKLIWKTKRKDPLFRRWGNGGDYPQKRKEEFKENVKRRIKDGVRVFASVDDRMGSLVPSIVSYYEKNGFSDIVILGHPKLASPGSIKIIDNLINRYKRKYTFEIL